MKITTNYKYKLFLFVSAFLFGCTFFVVKDLLTTMTPSHIVFWRYLVASFLFLTMGGIPKKGTIKDAIPLGIFLWLGYILQTQGLITTSTINSGIITGFYIVLTPIFSKIFLSKKILKKTIFACIFGFCGIILLSYSKGPFVIGNIITLACAASYALHIVFVQKNLKNNNIFQLMFVQSVIGFILSTPFLDTGLVLPSSEQIKYILFLGGVVNFGAFYLQLLGQRKVEASNAALILSLEAVFATLFGLILVGEVLSIINWFGILFTLSSIYIVLTE